MGNKNCDAKKNAYMTLEATLMYPLIFGGIIFTISLAIYLYNATVIKQISSVAALRGSLEYEMNEKEIKKYVNEEIDKLTKEKLIFVSKVEKDIEVTADKIKVRLETNVNLPFLKIPFLDFKWQELSFESQAKKVKTVSIIRGARRLYGS